MRYMGGKFRQRRAIADALNLNGTVNGTADGTPTGHVPTDDGTVPIDALREYLEGIE